MREKFYLRRGREVPCSTYRTDSESRQHLRCSIPEVKCGRCDPNDRHTHNKQCARYIMAGGAPGAGPGPGPGVGCSHDFITCLLPRQPFIYMYTKGSR